MSTTPIMASAASPAPIPSTPVAPAARSSRYSAYLALLPINGPERVSVVLNAHEDEYEQDSGDLRLGPSVKNFQNEFYTSAEPASGSGKKADIDALFAEIALLQGQPVSTATTTAINLVEEKAKGGDKTAIVMSALVNKLFNDDRTAYKGDFFNDLYNITEANTYTPTRNQSITTLSFLPDKFLLQKYMDSKMKMMKQKTGFETVVEAAPSAVTPENVYYRKVGNPTQLFTKLSDGTETSVEIGSAEWKNLTEQVSCYGTGLKPSGDKTCNEYITKCLQGQDINTCKEYMSTPGFWADAEKSVKTMSPTLMVDTLTAFGFKAVDGSTDKGVSVKIFPSTTKWLEGLSESLAESDKDTIAKIRDNKQLMGYLEMIVTKVNSNPGILNPTYVEGKPAYNPIAFEGSYLSGFGLKPKAIAAPTSIVPPPTPSAVSQLESVVVPFMTQLGVTFGIVPTLVMRGGGEYTLDVGSADSGYPLNVSEKLNNMYEKIIVALQEGGKDLDSADQQTIKKLINELEVLENKLFKSTSYSETYKNLLEVAQTGGSLFNSDNLSKFESKRNDYFDRVNQKYKVIFPIFSKLAEACAKETVTEKDVTTVAAFPKYD